MTRPLGGRCVPRAIDSNIVGHGVVDSCSPEVEGRGMGLPVAGVGGTGVDSGVGLQGTSMACDIDLRRAEKVGQPRALSWAASLSRPTAEHSAGVNIA